jgi:putative ABC transport system permease protein
MSAVARWHDVRFAVRVLRKNLGFASLVILSLALGIGATTAIFTIIDGLLFKSLPIRSPETLVQITKISQAPTLNNFSYPGFETLRESDHGLTGLFGWNRAQFPVEQNGVTQLVGGAYVTGAFFDTLGIQPALGRLLRPDDDRMSADQGGPAATISYGYWQRVFGEDRGVIGRRLMIGGVPFNIVGVQPRPFHGLEVGAPVDIIIPVTAERLLRGGSSMLQQRNASWLRLFGRLPDGVPEANVRARLRLVAPRLFEAVVPLSLAGAERQTFLAQQLDFAPAGTGLSDLRQRFTTPLSILLAIVGLVSLIASVNIANLLLVRATARRGEMAIRVALGGSRGDIIRQLVVEGMLISLTGGALGLLVSVWSSRLLLNGIAPSLGGLVLDIGLDYRILAFTGLVSMLVGIIFALAPVMTTRGLDVGATLKRNAANVSGTRRSMRQVLVICQVAVSVLLLVTAGLFVQSLRNLQTVDLGFTRENLLIVHTEPRARDADGATLAPLYAELLERLKLVPGVRLVTAARFGPLEGVGFTLRVRVPGVAEASPPEEVHVNAVGAKFFDAIGMRILRGRGFDERDTERSAKVVVINESMARHYFPDQDPVGKQIIVGGRATQPMEIVGLAEDVHYDGPRSLVARTVFTAWPQDPARLSGLSLLLRTSASTGTVAMAVRHEIETASDRLRVTNVASLREKIDRTLGQDRLLATLSGSFAWLGLILVSVGLYGVMAYTVARRTREIGVRMALGAQRQDIMWLVLRETLWLVLVGIFIGVPAALAATRGVSSMLFGMDAQGQLPAALAAVVMLVVAVIAAFVPARNASRVDPTIALRSE